ncbi:MAG: hypothetical protein A4S08_08675 [Proteobacteria bacterium SG_bin4]|nr:MAG: hypothetical protein A4S08_08675 [Proteobacteria bacterium SG_bin4]
MTTTLERILNKAAIRFDAVRDRVTDRAEEVLGSKKRVQTREIWAVGDFPNPWSSEQEEIDALLNDEWFPSTKDFAAAIKNSGAKGKSYDIVNHSASFINLIYLQPKGSIARLNFVTHGASDSIGLQGRIENDGVYFDEELEAGVLQGFKENGILKNDGTVVPWSDVKARFAKDAVIVVYACKAALSEDFLQTLADVFGVTVQGFTAELHYTYSEEALQNGKIDRKHLKVDGQSGIKLLSPNVTKKPSAPVESTPP